MVGNPDRRYCDDCDDLSVPGCTDALGAELFLIRKIAMYALVKTGGKQYRVSKDDTILVERLSAKEGEQIILSDIVMLAMETR